MAKQPLNGALQHIRKVAAVQTYRELSDCDLLERFVGARDEAAFTVLIERHGPMVLGVCRRALPNLHDAEDACQATFLVLARKASSVRKKTSLSSWLHGVACRVAAKLKRDHARRTTRERGIDAPAPRDPAAEVSWREVQAILDEELERLPERSRAPLILCYLECMTRDEAAKQLGLSPTTLCGRLERARYLLRTCLSKRGLTLAAAISATAVGEGAAQAALAPSFVVSSTNAAMVLAAGQPLTEAVVGTHVLALTQEVIKSMFLTKLKLGTVAVLCAGLFMAVIGGSFTSLSIAQDAKPEAAVDALARPTRQTATGQQGSEKPGNGKADQPERAPEKGELSLPRGTAPGQALVSLNKGKLVVRSSGMDSVTPVTKVVDGQNVTTYIIKEKVTTAVYDLKDVKIVDVKGKPIDVKNLPKLLNKEIAALIAKDGQQVDPLHLRLFNDETLLFLLPLPDPAPIIAVPAGDPVPMPGAPLPPPPVPRDPPEPTVGTAGK
jgi:RNA polymerase sigma factor (sigma-70 family)